jgi:FkbH-like protein
MTDELVGLLAQAMEVPAEWITEKSSADTLEKWDSLRQILVAKMLEQHYSITLSNDDLAELTSVASIRALLAMHGVNTLSTAALPTAEPDTLLGLLAQALEVTPDKIDNESSSETVEKWDSLRQILIAKMLEQHFAITLSNDDLAELASVRNIRALLAAHGVSTAGVVAMGEPAEPLEVSKADTLASLQASLRDHLTVNRIFDVAERLKAPVLQAAFAGPVVRVAVAGSLTTDFLTSAIACSGVLEETLPLVYAAPFASYVQELLDPASGLYAFRPDVVVLAPDWRETVVDVGLEASRAEVETALAERVSHFKRLWSLLRERTAAKIIQHTLVPPSNGFAGIAERRLPSSPTNQIAMLNTMLIEAATELVTWVEVDRLAALHGLANWNASRYFFTSKLPFDPQFLPAYVNALRGAWRIAHGRVKKVLALDLDNTLWGGVIGDDGVAGIKLGPDTAAGEAFTDWGLYIKELARRGVILAACSKNNPTVALEGFEHAHSPLKRGDFAAFEVSWDDKVGGLRRIAKTLNLGIDTVVFADDNPFECDLVRQNLPEVAVIELGTDPSAFVGLLDAGHWFDLPSYTKEDLQRTESYRGRQEAESERETATDLAAYLRGLRMIGELHIADAAELPRLAQMELKTNQFNLTTRRYSADVLRDLMADANSMVFGFQLRDRHADHGLVSSLVGKVEGDVFRIDSWLMSCRVFSRGVEEFIVNHVVDEARNRGCSRLMGEYLPTAKNEGVADLYSRLKFSPLDNNGRLWELPLAEATAHETFITAPNEEATADKRLSMPVTPAPEVEVPAELEAARAAMIAQDWAMAAVYWSSVRDAGPASLEAYVQGADALLRTGRTDEAEQVAESLEQLFPDNEWGAILLAESALQRGDLPQTRLRIQALRTRFPNSSVVMPRLALSLRSAGAGEELAQLLIEANAEGQVHPVFDDVRIWLADKFPVWKNTLRSARHDVEAGQVSSLILDKATIARACLPRAVTKKVVVYGSCQADMLKIVLQRMLVAHEEFEVVAVYAHLPELPGQIDETALAGTVLYLEQFDGRPSVPMRDKLRGCLAPDVPKLSFPLLTLQSLWPFDWPDYERNVAQPPRFPFGRFPYGDSIGMEVSREGLRGQRGFDRYMELSDIKMPKLDVLFERDIGAIRKRDAGSDIKMAEWVTQNYNKANLFFSWGHPSVVPILEMARQLLPLCVDQLGIRPEWIERLIASVTPWQDSLMVPFHPTVAEYHDLAFYKPDMTFRWQGQNWTFRDYTIAYIDNAADW